MNGCTVRSADTKEVKKNVDECRLIHKRDCFLTTAWRREREFPRSENTNAIQSSV